MSKLLSSYLKFEIDYHSDKMHLMKKTEKKWHTLLLLWHILVFISVLHRMTFIGHVHSSQFM